MSRWLSCLLSLSIMLSLQAEAQDSLAITSTPKLYRKRSTPEVNVALIYYGDYYKDEDLARVQDLLEERFHLATDKSLSINTKFRKILPFKNQLEDFPDYRQDYVTDPERLQRLWYYDNVGMAVVNEVYQQTRGDLESIDFLLVVTGAQFDSLGFASGRIAVTENPMEIAWGLADGGRVEYVSDAQVVDELIHEMGHTMYLGHASDQCFGTGVSYEESQACCKKSAAKDDVMSYCRRRNLVDEKVFYGFKECNLRNIKEKIIPSMLSGGEWAIKDLEVCL